MCDGGVYKFSLQEPGVFMTDNSRAEEDALRAVWPSLRQLLCHFHSLQAEWRWLTTGHNAAKNERPQLMAAFQKVGKGSDPLEIEKNLIGAFQNASESFNCPWKIRPA